MNVIVYDLPGSPGLEYHVPDARVTQLTVVQQMALSDALALIAQQALPAGATNLVFTTDDQLPTLWQAQNRQIAVLTAAAEAQITGGTQSSALGAPHIYATTRAAQINMTASVLDAVAPAPLWVASTAYAVGQTVQTSTGLRLLCSAAGTSGATEPTAAGEDGSVTWAAWTTLFIVSDTSGNPSVQQHTQAQITQAARDCKAMIVAAEVKLAALAAEVLAATTVAAVQAIIWTFP